MCRTTRLLLRSYIAAIRNVTLFWLYNAFHTRTPYPHLFLYKIELLIPVMRSSLRRLKRLFSFKRFELSNILFTRLKKKMLLKNYRLSASRNKKNLRLIYFRTSHHSWRYIEFLETLIKSITFFYNCTRQSELLRKNL